MTDRSLSSVNNRWRGERSYWKLMQRVSEVENQERYFSRINSSIEMDWIPAVVALICWVVLFSFRSTAGDQSPPIDDHSASECSPSTTWTWANVERFQFKCNSSRPMNQLQHLARVELDAILLRWGIHQDIILKTNQNCDWFARKKTNSTNFLRMMKSTIDKTCRHQRWDCQRCIDSFLSDRVSSCFPSLKTVSICWVRIDHSIGKDHLRDLSHRSQFQSSSFFDYIRWRNGTSSCSRYILIDKFRKDEEKRKTHTHRHCW